VRATGRPRLPRLFIGLLCTVVPVDLTVAERAAALRAEHGLRTPDALICATALGAAAVVVGNDLRWKQTDLPYVHIDDVVSRSS
jgi:predicted nucleic acid-binding protein